MSRQCLCDPAPYVTGVVRCRGRRETHMPDNDNDNDNVNDSKECRDMTHLLELAVSGKQDALYNMVKEVEKMKAGTPIKLTCNGKEYVGNLPDDLGAVRLGAWTLTVVSGGEVCCQV